MSEVRRSRERAEKTRRAPTRGRPPKRIRRRETPGPPAPVIVTGKVTAKGRGASLEEMLGTREARVLVVETVGKQKSVECIHVRAPRTGASRVVGGRTSPSHTAKAADAEGSEPILQQTDGARGAVRSHVARRGTAPQRRRMKVRSPSATVRARHARTSQGRNDGSLCPASRGAGYARLKRRADLRRQAVDSIRRKAP